MLDSGAEGPGFKSQPRRCCDQDLKCQDQDQDRRISVSSGLETETAVSRRTTRRALHAGIRQEKRRYHPSYHSHQSTNFKWEFRERERMVILLTPKFLA